MSFRTLSAAPAVFLLMLLGVLLVFASTSLVLAKPVNLDGPCGKIAMIKLGAPAVGQSGQAELSDGQTQPRNEMASSCFDASHFAIPVFLALRSPAPAAVRHAPPAPELRSFLTPIELPPPRLSA